MVALSTGGVLDRADTWPVIQALLITAAVCSRRSPISRSPRIRVRPEPRSEAGCPRRGAGRVVVVCRRFLAAVGCDRRFLLYLWGSAIFQLGNLMYEPLVRAFMSSELQFN